MTKKIISVLVLLLLVLIVFWIFTNGKQVIDKQIEVVVSSNSNEEEKLKVLINQNLSNLAPVLAQLGGTFFVTSIEAQNGVGKVEYEDGHDVYTADFTYASDAEGNMSIQSFTLHTYFTETTVSEDAPEVILESVTETKRGSFVAIDIVHKGSGDALMVTAENGTRILRFEEIF